MLICQRLTAQVASGTEGLSLPIKVSGVWQGENPESRTGPDKFLLHCFNGFPGRARSADLKLSVHQIQPALRSMLGETSRLYWLPWRGKVSDIHQALKVVSCAG
jgi:hypothetical protein